ncbi:hypothetical protein B0H11DRAFT_1963979 [Mycena galericulata]|nr:hypothetical protein B0H11DRAFT_1963979 [Mycena galericulata]
MEKRYGAEGIHGIGGGGIVSEESQRNLEIAEDLCRRGKPNDAAPYLMKALDDHNNVDADIQMAYLSPDLLFSVEVLEFAEKKARALLINHLGPDCFDDGGPCVGKFWEIVLTRPYMRVLQALVRMCFETKQFEKATNTIIEMMRLCPQDSLNQAFWLGPFLIRTGRHADALFFCQVRLEATKNNSIPLRGGTVFRTPSPSLLTPETEERYSKYAASDMTHTAALAAFKLWGRCPQAAQLLRIAVRSNPAILVKIIARRARPVQGTLTSRMFNGQEEAHDYLWMAQDLWMEPDVWDWVNEDPTVMQEILKCCSRPDCPAQETEVTQFKRCAACWQVVYCGPGCQKSDWKRHKPECVKQVEFKKNRKKVSKNKPTNGNVYVLKDGIVHQV